MNQKLRKPYLWVMIAALVISCVAQCCIPPASYFTYHINEYSENTEFYILSLVNFVYIFLIFSYGILEIYNVKRLAGIFLIIQPAILIIEFISNFVLDITRMNIVNPVFKLFLTLWFICLANLFLSDRRGFSKNFRKNIKPILKSLLIAILLGIAVVIARLAVNYISIMVLNTTMNYYVIPIAVAVNFVIWLVIFLVGVFIIGNMLNNVYIYPTYPTDMLSGKQSYPSYQFNYEDKRANILICCVVVVLIIASTAYFLIKIGNQVALYLDFINGA